MSALERARDITKISDPWEARQAVSKLVQDMQRACGNRTMAVQLTLRNFDTLKTVGHTEIPEHVQRSLDLLK